MSVTIAAFAVIAIIIIISWLCSRGRTPEPAPKRLENNEQMPLPDSTAHKDRNISELQSKWETINWFSKEGLSLCIRGRYS
jgi:hypothetical protein